MTRHDTQDTVSDPLWNRLARTPDADTRDERFSYESLLRCVGQLLDSRGAVRVHVLEVVDGFSLRYQTSRDSAESLTATLTHAALDRTARDMEARRNRLSFHFGRRANDSNYADILRALGYELDVIKAYSLLVDELDDGLVVTYQFLKPSEGFNVRKRMVILGHDAVRTVIEDAHARREHRKNGVLTLLAG